MSWKNMEKKEIEELNKIYSNRPAYGEFYGEKAEVETQPFADIARKSKKWKKVEKEMTNQNEIAQKCNEIKNMLLQKNDQYGDSVLTPNRMFSKAATDEQIKVRIDDKLNRLIKGNDSMEADEDIIKDLIGYLILLLVHADGQDESQMQAGDS